MTGERKSALEDLIRASVLTDKLLAARANLKLLLCARGEAFYAETIKIHREAIKLYAERAKITRAETALRLSKMFLADHEQINALGVLAAWLEMIEDGYVEKTMKAIEEMDA